MTKLIKNPIIKALYNTIIDDNQFTTYYIAVYKFGKDKYIMATSKMEGSIGGDELDAGYYNYSFSGDDVYISFDSMKVPLYWKTISEIIKAHNETPGKNILYDLTAYEFERTDAGPMKEISGNFIKTNIETSIHFVKKFSDQIQMNIDKALSQASKDIKDLL